MKLETLQNDPSWWTNPETGVVLIGKAVAMFHRPTRRVFLVCRVERGGMVVIPEFLISSQPIELFDPAESLHSEDKEEEGPIP